MAEIRLDVDYTHSVERVWRALTDPRITEQWFVPGTIGTTVGGQYQLRPRETDGLAGPIDVEVLEAVEAGRLVMQWTGERLHTEMTWALLPTEGGCRLSIVQSGFIGTPQSVRRLELCQVYTVLFTEALPPVLDRLAAGEVDLGSGTPLLLNTALPRPPRKVKAAGTPAGFPAWWPARWRTASTAAAVVALLVLAVVVLVLGLSNGDTRHQTQPLPQPIEGASLGPDVSVGGARAGGHNPSGHPSAEPSASIAVLAPALGSDPTGAGALGGGALGGGAAGGPSAAPAGGAGAARFTATYAPANSGNNGQGEGQITIGVSGSGTVTGWTVVITLAGGGKVTSAQNATLITSGSTATLTPAGNATLSAGQQAQVVFFYNRPKETSVASCAVNGDACM